MCRPGGKKYNVIIICPTTRRSNHARSFHKKLQRHHNWIESVGQAVVRSAHHDPPRTLRMIRRGETRVRQGGPEHLERRDSAQYYAYMFILMSNHLQERKWT